MMELIVILLCILAFGLGPVCGFVLAVNGLFWMLVIMLRASDRRDFGCATRRGRELCQKRI